ncbi:MAG: sensor histidine kinase [Myxococcota bacterium]
MLIPCVAHEINNPITYVLANLSELQKLAAAMREALLSYRAELERRLGAEATDRIASIETKLQRAGGLEALDEVHADAQEGALRIRDVVRDLLTVSRSSEHTSAPLDIHATLESSLRLVGRRLEVRARLVSDFRATKTIEGDPARLAQVFLNLIINAIHACEPPDPERRCVSVRTQDSESGILVEIADTGTGIAPEIADRIFEPFFTTKENGMGTGLGLYISRRIIEDHGGTISFHPNHPEGTIFRIHLPQGPPSDER